MYRSREHFTINRPLNLYTNIVNIYEANLVRNKVCTLQQANGKTELNMKKAVITFTASETSSSSSSSLSSSSSSYLANTCGTILNEKIVVMIVWRKSHTAQQTLNTNQDYEPTNTVHAESSIIFISTSALDKIIRKIH